MFAAFRRSPTCLTCRPDALPAAVEAPTLRHMPSATHTLCLTALVAVLGVGCGAPAVEGVVDGAAFTIDDQRPDVRGAADDVLLVLFQADDDAGELRTLSLDLPATSSLTVGKAMHIGGDDDVIGLDVVVGDLVRVPLSNGESLLTSSGMRQAVARDGSVTFDVADDGVFVGHFSVDLDDGGYVAGRFSSQP